VRISLLPHRNDWSELQKDAVKTLEYAVANRGNWRRGDVVEIPLTLSHIQWWLEKTGARRKGRDYARDVRNALQRDPKIRLLRDTAELPGRKEANTCRLLPRMQPDVARKSGRSHWWPLYVVIPIAEAQRVWRERKRTSTSVPSLTRPSGPSRSRLRRDLASLCGWLRSQGVLSKPSKPVRGSMQWVFAGSGPP